MVRLIFLKRSEEKAARGEKDDEHDVNPTDVFKRLQDWKDKSAREEVERKLRIGRGEATSEDNAAQRARTKK